MSPFSIIILSFLVICIILTFVGMLKMRKKGFATSTIIGVIILTFLFTGSSIFWTKDIAYDRETLQHLEFGWPIHFYVQNQSRFEPPFPYAMNFDWESSIDFNNKNFYSSVASNFLGILLIWLLITFYLKRIYGRKIG